MDKGKKYVFQVGLFTLIGLVIFIIAIIVIGKKQNLFNDTIKVTTTFKNVQGLKAGNNVRFTGIDVGTVLKMQILTDTSVVVTMSLDEDVIPFIKKSSLATIGNEGLMGNKIIMILPGHAEGTPIEEGDELIAVEPVEIDDILNEIQKSSERIARVSNNLIDITEKINRGDGVFGKLFTDTGFTNNIGKTGYNISQITTNLLEISEKVNSGEGILGKVFTDTVLANDMGKASLTLNNISDNLEEITYKINHGEGIISKLFIDSALTHNLYQSSENLAITTENFMKVSNNLQNQNNALNKLISDTAFADSLEILLFRLNTGVMEATEAAEAIQNSGVIRAFSKDKDK